MITLSSADSQIVFYAKGHFGYMRDTLEDLRILVATWTGMPPASINDRDVVSVLMQVLDKLNLKMDASFIQQIVFGSFLQTKRNNPTQNFLTAAMNLIQGMPVKDRNGTLVELQPLDPNALSVPVPA